MTPKEKAEELIKNFGKVDIFIQQEPTDIDCKIEDTDWKGTAEVCAILLVDEILKVISEYTIEPIIFDIEYWQEVKQEIEKL